MIIGALSRASAEGAPTLARGARNARVRSVRESRATARTWTSFCAALAVYSRSALIVSAVFFSSAESRPLPSSSVDVKSVLPSAKAFIWYQARFHSQPRL